MKHPSKNHSVFRVELIDDIVDEYVLDSNSLHDKKHSFLSDLHSLCPYALNLIMNLIFVMRVFLIL